VENIQESQSELPRGVLREEVVSLWNVGGEMCRSIAFIASKLYDFVMQKLHLEGKDSLLILRHQDFSLNIIFQPFTTFSRPF
jgi:hypothetical protein